MMRLDRLYRLNALDDRADKLWHHMNHFCPLLTGKR
jgi:hypothetical protein